MSSVTLRTRGLFPTEWPTFAWLPLGGPSIRIEEFLDTQDYVVRAELPGVDPKNDIHVTVTDGGLVIKVERKEEHRTEDGKVVHSEFHYGSLFRHIPLPGGARGDKVTATYEAGILEVRVAVGEVVPKTREIPVIVGNGKPAAIKKS
ncbi:HSP20 family protein [Asanoa hainanensis]|uniref:HSP20 family protein n=1 Tax=Asanoa hainanensis TaxID=560556 RepID=A0A239P1P8_9ACTN|nr:Hsp20/alpha crystallin family protein [Asanoa hainanensis]SNT60920.1 HSP20 family protein [Asanoa hainanensis]